MGNVTGKMYLKTEGQKYSEGVVLDQPQLGTFQKIHFKVTAIKGTGFTEELIPNTPDFKAVKWKLVNVTKSVEIDMDCFPAPYCEKYVTSDWRGDTIRAMPKLGCTELITVEFYINTYYV
jgi:hypothetical protein